MMPTKKSPFSVVCGSLVAALSLSAAACSLDKQEMPALAGPSEFALAVTMAALPDQLPRDGSSQSVVTITARDAQSKPLAGQRINVSLSGVAPQGAALSQGEVVTDAGGHATVTVTAPAPGSIGDISIVATAVGTNGGNSSSRVIQIRAMPQNNAPPDFPCTQQSSPCAAPFTVNPSIYDSGTNTFGNISVRDPITFDASCSPSTTCASRGVTDEGVPCNACTFAWNFGGDGTATGPIVRHAFGAGGIYLVTLTVTDSSGVSSVTSALLSVSGIVIPTNITLTISPASPVAKQAATYTVKATPATNHRIVSFQFNWGDGNTSSLNTGGNPDSSGVITSAIQYTYSQAGSYLITVTARDDLGQSATIYSAVTVTSGLSASFAPSISGTTVTFTATASSSIGSTITDYAWDFDSDGTYDTNGSSASVSHDYGASGTYRATLKVTDTGGVTQTYSASVTVP